MLMWHYIKEESDDKSFMVVERVSWGMKLFYTVSKKYWCVEN